MSSRKCKIAKTPKIFLEVVEKRKKAFDKLTIFAIYSNFQKCLFRAVEVLEVGKNMQKMTFFNFKLPWDMGSAKYGMVDLNTKNNRLTNSVILQNKKKNFP